MLPSISKGDLVVTDFGGEAIYRVEFNEASFTLDDASPDDGDRFVNSRRFDNLPVGSYSITGAGNGQIGNSRRLAVAVGPIPAP